MAKRIIAIIILAVCLLSMHSAAFAQHDVPDFSRTANVSIAMRYGTKPVTGGTMTAYRVGEIIEVNGDFIFAPTGEFTAWGSSFEDISSKDLAKELLAFAKENEVEDYATVNIGGDALADFSDMELGLYLFTQKDPCPGYYSVAPFLVSLPGLDENGCYVYDISIDSKTELVKAPVYSAPPPHSQTGQLNWPVPLLAIVGILLFTSGWILFFGRKREEM